MQRILVALALISVGLISLSPLAAKEESKDDAKTAVGQWKVMGGEAGGQKLPADKIPKSRFEIKEDLRFVAELGDEKMEGTCEFDQKKDPSELNVTHEGGNHSGKEQFGIYKFEDDRFIVCIAEPGAPKGERPAKFSTDEHCKCVLFIFERD